MLVNAQGSTKLFFPLHHRRDLGRQPEGLAGLPKVLTFYRGEIELEVYKDLLRWLVNAQRLKKKVQGSDTKPNCLSVAGFTHTELTKWATDALNAVVTCHANKDITSWKSMGDGKNQIKQLKGTITMLHRDFTEFQLTFDLAKSKAQMDLQCDNVVTTMLLDGSFLSGDLQLRQVGGIDATRFPSQQIKDCTTAKWDAVDRNPKRTLWAEALINILNTARENIEQMNNRLIAPGICHFFMDISRRELFLHVASRAKTLAVCETLGAGMGTKQKDVDGGKDKGKEKEKVGTIRARRCQRIQARDLCCDRALDYSSLTHVHCVVDLEDMNMITVSSEERRKCQLFGCHTLPLPNKFLTALLEIPKALDVYSRLTMVNIILNWFEMKNVALTIESFAILQRPVRREAEAGSY
ncbi:hypothetical protein DFJ58DRAFT_875266 [Suillus subalutaceus]|uniref:uncharacterized protein n=1 Tax=Suillus subalutaceus TaxID=48586 RepID=UPI001B86D96D|nr:uncharacterized protein DFJ58DRAFT_875266 [Suillus subalutaceus]KAG1859540.1 hypothetical protein DFJ58DRAFT_875266 [Suillus subalutaceus]